MTNKPISEVIAEIKRTKGNRKFRNNLEHHLSDYAGSIVGWLKVTSPKRIDALIEHIETLEQQLSFAQNISIDADCERMELRQQLKNETHRADQNASYIEMLTERMLTAEQQLAAERAHNVTNVIRTFVTDDDIKALNRFAECCDDPESGGHDLEKEQVTRLEKIGALRRSGRISYITDFDDLALSLRLPVGGGE